MPGVYLSARPSRYTDPRAHRDSVRPRPGTYPQGRCYFSNYLFVLAVLYGSDTRRKGRVCGGDVVIVLEVV